MEITLYHWLTLSSFLFAIGIYGVLTRSNGLMTLMSLELMLNAAALNFVAFNRYLAPSAISGQLFTVFVIAVAAAEAAVGFAIMIRLYRSQGNIELGQATLMKN
ncbi:MAG: NADH-quinone oxidoreductase subunit NuoK [bacterium]|nr:NADH-quinone oxidoreductase subunit NuoK [bacterium]